MNFKRHAVFLIICFLPLLLFACATAIGQGSLIEYPKQLPLPLLIPGWQRVSIPQVGTIDIPPTMEVKSESYKVLTGLTTNEQQFTVQQKGLNELHPDAHKLYVRVMIDTEISKPDEYDTLYSRWSLTEQELEELSKATKLQIEREALAASAEMLKSLENNLKQMTDAELRKAVKGTLKDNISDTNLKEMRYKLYEAMKQERLKTKSLKLVEWFPFKVEGVNGMLALCHTYRRQLGTNPIVHCKRYTFQNCDRIHTLTMSFRESERGIWEKDFPAILSSFRITNTQKLSPTTEISDSIMKNMFGEYWFLTLLLSAVLTWGIGLTPPLLIRYAIIKRPLPKKAAIPLVVLFWFINIIIFTALGSQSKTHAALFLVAWASYYILHRKYATWQKKGVQTNDREYLMSKDKDSDPVKSTPHVDQINNNNNEIMPHTVATYVEKELNKSAHLKYKPSVTSESIKNRSNNRTKETTDTPPQEQRIAEEALPKPGLDPIMSGRLEKCANCDRTIGKLEHSYMIKGNIVCVKCYQVLSSKNV